MHASKLEAAQIETVSIFASELESGDRFVAPDTQRLVTVRRVEQWGTKTMVDVRGSSYFFGCAEEVWVVVAAE